MTNNRRSFWLNLSLVNLCIVAFFGFTLRSKILFSLPFIDFRSLESAHSHFAFAGWAGLALVTLLIYDLLPESLSQKKIYQWALTGIEISSLGMAFTFPFYGYNTASIFFSSLYVLTVFVLTPVFIKDVLRTSASGTIKLLAVSALLSLVLSFSGTLGLVYILLTGSGGSLLYRDSIYTFLHFQYNGFFTLSVFALFFSRAANKGLEIGKQAKRFSLFLCLSILPSLFLSLLWHNLTLYYVLAAVGGVLILLSLAYFFSFLRLAPQQLLFSFPLAGTLWLFSVFSFGLKMVLQVGTIFPQLGNAVYGDRPVIIGFLHLVFLGFLTFYLLSTLVENGYFTKNKKAVAFPFAVFTLGIFSNEFLLMLQGLGILFKTNHDIYKWLLWGAAIILFTGAVLITATKFYIGKNLPHKK